MYTLILEILFNQLSALIESGDKTLMVFMDENDEGEKEEVKLYYSEILKHGLWHEKEIGILKEKKESATKYSLNEVLMMVIHTDDPSVLK